MSTILRLNVTAVLAVISLLSVIGGGIWAVSARDSDIAELQTWRVNLDTKVERHHDDIADMRGDLKTIKTTLERIDRKIP